MRTMSIPSSKAAYDRLRWMRDPLAQAIPFDADTIAPFGLRVMDTRDHNNVVRLTYKGAVVGSVGRHDGQGFALHVALPVSETVDRVIRRVFEMINQHHLQVARFLAEQKQRQRGDPEAIAEARARQQEADRLALEEIAAEEAARLHKINDERNRCNGFDLIGEPDQGAMLTGFTFEDIEAAAGFKGKDDELDVVVWHYDARPRTFNVITKGGYEWTFAEYGESTFKLGGDHSIFPDFGKIASVVRTIVDRNVRVQYPDRIQTLLNRLDEPRYSIEMFSMSETELPEVSCMLHVDDEISFRIHEDSIKFNVDGVEVARWIIRKDQINLESAVFPLMCKVLEREEFGTPEVLSKIGSIWLSQVLPASHLDDVRFLDADDVERDALSIDVGYNL